ncbi:MAG TPA: DinB family protein [Thermoanaerobaculia bacterium]|nr:DinB family protein [Thermoanaerobaculia bacterium]
MTDTRRTIDAVWRIESARLIAGLARMVRDVGLAEDLAQDALGTRPPRGIHRLSYDRRRTPSPALPDPEIHVSISASLLPEFDHEMASTRRILERLPDDRLSWRPHAKSMTMGRLASHVAELLRWLHLSLDRDSFDVAPPEGPSYRPADLSSRQEILDLFDRKVAAARERLLAVDDASFGQFWRLLRGGQELLTLPRLGVYRTMIINHMIHHRGQLSVYLRLNDVPVPGMYGPSADEM